MLMLMFSIYDLVNDNNINREEIKKRILALIDEELEKEKKELRNYENNMKENFINIEKRYLKEISIINSGLIGINSIMDNRKKEVNESEINLDLSFLNKDNKYE